MVSSRLCFALCSMLACVLLAGCTASTVTPLGTAPPKIERASVGEDSVKVYLDSTSVPCSYTHVALVTVESGESTSSMIGESKKEAAEVGANAILLRGSSDSYGARPGRASAIALLEDRPCDE